jgi:excisionase family DNA binding protein
MQELLTLREAAERLRISPQTLMNWRSKGKGPKSAKFGGGVRYRPEDIDTWIDQQFKGNTNG